MGSRLIVIRKREIGGWLVDLNVHCPQRHNDMTKLLLFCFLALSACINAQIIVPVTGTWQQMGSSPDYALTNAALGVYNSGLHLFAVFGGQNNTAGGVGWEYSPSSGGMVSYPTNDSFSFPNHVYLFKATRGTSF